ncbi:30S ribosomal protein S27e [archaeon]|nr:30S ribosomal protein S27e [archaeon]
MSKFLIITCPECGNKQRIFARTSTEIKCQKCEKLLAKPTGGKAEIFGKITKVLE